MASSPSPFHRLVRAATAILLSFTLVHAMVRPATAQPVSDPRPNDVLPPPPQPPGVVRPQPAPRPEHPENPPAPVAQPAGPAQPFGANMFTGAYAGQREDALNPEYRLMPGDRVMVNAWGSLAINDVFTVDTQGNIFLPNIGPVHLAGVRNQELTETVRAAIARVYRANFGVYTNLLTSSPVAIFVTGGVQRPGRYAGIPSDSVLFFLDQAGGIDPELGSFRKISVIRRGTTLAEIDLYEFLLRGTLPTVQLADGDTILVGRRGPTVEIRGMVMEPALIELTSPVFTGADVLAVVPSAARANEVTLRGMRASGPWVGSFSVQSFHKAALKDGDVVTFREEGRAERILVRIEGEFLGPAMMSVRRGTRLLDLLNYVQVDPELAQTEAVHVRRVRVAQQQKESIEQALDRLERSAMLAFSSSRGEAELRVREAELVSDFVKRARIVQPLGRVVTKTAGHQLNVVLEEEDVIVIPPRTNVVRITGEVNFTQAVMYRPDLTVKDYIRMSGGYTNRADRGTAIVIRPSAEVAIGSTGMPVQPGDEIMIPPRIDKKTFQNAIDLSQVIYQLAVAASVLIRFW